MKSYTFCGRTTQQTFLLKTQRSSHLPTGWRQRILEANEAPWDCNKQHWGHWGCTNTLNKIQERKKNYGQELDWVLSDIPTLQIKANYRFPRVFYWPRNDMSAFNHEVSFPRTWATTTLTQPSSCPISCPRVLKVSPLISPSTFLQIGTDIVS